MLNIHKFSTLRFPVWHHSRLASSAAKNVQNKENKNENNFQSLFQHSRIGNFFQDRPVLHNPYLSDSLLKSFIRRHIPKEYLGIIEEDLTKFGTRICDDVNEHGEKCERNPPKLTHYDAWGRRVDRIDTCDSWKYMKKVSAEEGIVAAGYERNYGGARDRIYQMAKLFLFSPSSGLYSCPLAMTDGATRIIESLVNDPSSDSSILGNAYRRLTSRDPSLFWTSGQWMTEKRGGSDVANGTETLAYKQDDGTYRLYGYKWFTSATDADVTFTLARIVDRDYGVTPGSRGLSLFFLHTRGEEGRNADNGLNGIQVQRLKDKLGTRQLPTAELLLDGTIAHQVGEESHGVRSISGMLTLTRIHTALSSASMMRRLLQLAVDYSKRRTAFGARVSDHALHIQTLARMDIECRAAFLLVFELVRMLGLEEANEATKEDLGVLRLLTPVCKLYTAKQSLVVCTEGLECFGGAGYMEDTGLPRYLRDAQVCSIWEGTTNILSLDVLRAIKKSGGEVLSAFFTSSKSKLKVAQDSGKGDLVDSCNKVDSALGKLHLYVEEEMFGEVNGLMKGDSITLMARDLSYSLARIYMAVLLLEHASWEGAGPSDIYVAKRWCEQDLCAVSSNSSCGWYLSAAEKFDKELVFDSYQGEN